MEFLTNFLLIIIFYKGLEVQNIRFVRRRGVVVSAPASNPEVMGSRLVAATIVGVCVLGQDT